MKQVGLLISGAEILDGRVLDTNSNLFAQKLSEIGIQLTHTITCGDSIQEISDAIKYLDDRCAFILISGGLGPTTDDLTREGVAKFQGVELLQNEASLEHLKAWYKKRGRELDPGNLKQALLPKGALMMPNPVGTAPGFFLNLKSGSVVAALPGVPKEFRAMLDESVLPAVKKHISIPKPLYLSLFKFFGIAESTLGRIINACNNSKEIEVSYRAVFPEVHVTLKTRESLSLLTELRAKILEKIDPSFVYSEDAQSSFTRELNLILSEKNVTVSCAESCTAGMIGAMLTVDAGSSKYFQGGVIAYDNQIKTAVLNVADETLIKYGAVSTQVAEEMATGARKLLKTDYAISITGIAGPDGGTKEKPVGTFCVGLAHPKGVSSYKFLYVSDREGIRRFSAFVALDILRRALLGYSVPEQYPVTLL